jgi:hypothetical protein
MLSKSGVRSQKKSTKIKRNLTIPFEVSHCEIQSTKSLAQTWLAMIQFNRFQSRPIQAMTQLLSHSAPWQAETIPNIHILRFFTDFSILGSLILGFALRLRSGW